MSKGETADGMLAAQNGMREEKSFKERGPPPSANKAKYATSSDATHVTTAALNYAVEYKLKRENAALE